MNAFIWALVGVILAIVELVTVGIAAVFFSFSAFVIAIVLLIVPLSIELQISIFIGLSIIGLVNLRKLILRKITNKKDLDNDIIGNEAKVVDAISKNKDGKVLYNGTNWQARSNTSFEKGELVKIIDKKGLILIVESKEGEE